MKQFHSKRHGILRRVLRIPGQKNEMAVVEIVSVFVLLLFHVAYFQTLDDWYLY